jgi:CheY-like chemotaxis protein
LALILVVDDSPMIQKVANAFLTRKGHDVRVVGTVKGALTRMEAERFDLILMDLNLPDMPGDQAIEVIRKVKRVGAPIIVLSAEIKVDVVLKLQPYGVTGFVAKSDDFIVRLSGEVDKALAG